jgi:hypothetical protein
VTPILLSEVTLSLRTTEQLTECYLTWKSDFEQYQIVDRSALFNLKPELRDPKTVEFSPDASIQITATLQPDLLSELVPHVTTSESVTEYLLALNQENPNHPLFSTENWFALSVTQQQSDREVGYQTLWATLNPAQIAAGTLQFLEQVSNFLDDLAETSSTTILEQVIKFFTTDDWSFTKLQGQSALVLAFQGTHGEWTCYAQAREEQQQFIFYSLCPLKSSDGNRSAIAEFLTHANYGMMIGNFELDYTDGEIRYKTSIDVEDATLTDALIKTLVYTNITMMDTYLPGISAIVTQGLSPEAAIALIETANQASLVASSIR